jgi:hypothetical protein
MDRSRSNASRWWLLGLLGLLAAAVGCSDGGGGSLESAATTETTAERDEDEDEGEGDERDDEPSPDELRDLRDDYVDEISLSELGDEFNREETRCVAAAIVDTVGVEVLVADEVDPEEFADFESFEDAGIELDDAQHEDLSASLGDCLLDSIVPMLEQMFTDSVDVVGQDCIIDVIGGLIGEALATSLTTGIELNPDLAAKGTEAGLVCRWDETPTAPESGITMADGREEFVAAAISELSAPVVQGVSTLTEDEATCVVPAIVEIVVADQPDDAVTARQVTEYVSGISPDTLELDVDGPEAEALADEFVACIDFESYLARSFSLFDFEGMGLDGDAVVACLLERLPPDSLREAFVIQFRYGNAGHQSAPGAELAAEQDPIYQTCFALGEQ